jgi:hypothetical protein
MSRMWIVAMLLSVTSLAAVFAQSAQAAAMRTHESNSPARSGVNSAQYAELAGYFHQQEAKYRAEAAAEKIERDRRAQINAGMMQKYPRPVDSAQYSYASYLQRADNAALQARHYDQLAADSHPSSDAVRFGQK